MFGNQLKSTTSQVSTHPILAENGQVIDALFSYSSVANRIVGSPERSGLMNTIMMALSLETGRRYKGIK